MPKRFQKDKSLPIAVIGAGAWGTALANHLANKGQAVRLWALEPEVVHSIHTERENKLFLAGVPLHRSLTVTNSLAEAASSASLVIVAVPSQFIRAILPKLLPYLAPKTLLVNVAKGIEIKTGQLLSEIYAEILPRSLKKNVTYLSGPSFALEVARGHPAAVTVAGYDSHTVRSVQKILSSPLFRVYTSADVVGVELGGALKNVIAIAIGISDGLEMGHNARAALITRALHEMTRLGHKMGAQSLTFMGLAGLGDLILTCTGDLSRNRTVGMELAHGKTLKQIMSARRSVAEGIPTAAAVHKLAKKYKVEMPISEKVYQILYQGKSIHKAILELAARPLKEELKGFS